MKKNKYEYLKRYVKNLPDNYVPPVYETARGDGVIIKYYGQPDGTIEKKEEDLTSIIQSYPINMTVQSLEKGVSLPSSQDLNVTLDNLQSRVLQLTALLDGQKKIQDNNQTSASSPDNNPPNTSNNNDNGGPN